jgi:predicted nucleotidyltransferase
LERLSYDLDFAVAVPSWEAFEALRQALLNEGSFRAVDGNRHRLVQHGQTRVDLIPIDGTERPDGTIIWPPANNEVMTVLGYREAMATSEKVLLPGGLIMRVVCLPMLMALKLIAWSERGGETEKDATDCWSILSSYQAVGNQDRVYEIAASWPDTAETEFEVDVVAAWLLGSDIGKCLDGPDQRARAQILHIVEQSLALGGESALIRRMSLRQPDDALHRLSALRSGLLGVDPWRYSPEVGSQRGAST